VHPVLFRIGSFPVGSYALTALLGLAACVAVFSWLAARHGGGRALYVEIGLWAFVIGIGISKLFGVVTDFDPDRPLESAERALRFAGHYWVGFLAAVVYLVFALRRTPARLGGGLDALAPGLALGHAIGRVGCFLAGCCWGKACDLPWAVTFPPSPPEVHTGVPVGVPLHPTQLYESLAELLICGLLLLLYFRARRFAGQVFLTYVLVYGVARFLLEELRADPRGEPFWGLSSTQALLIPTAVVAVVAWLVLWRRAQAER